MALLEINPQHELCFVGPFTENVAIQLRLKNVSSGHVAFKVKTTAPKKYCVRPTSSYLSPGASTNVDISLLPFDYDPTEKPKHKFMVQAMAISSDKVDSLDSVWKSHDGPTSDFKLKCAFIHDTEELSSNQSVSHDIEVTPVSTNRSTNPSSQETTTATTACRESTKCTESPPPRYTSSYATSTPVVAVQPQGIDKKMAIIAVLLAFFLGIMVGTVMF